MEVQLDQLKNDASIIDVSCWSRSGGPGFSTNTGLSRKESIILSENIMYTLHSVMETHNFMSCFNRIIGEFVNFIVFVKISYNYTCIFWYLPTVRSVFSISIKRYITLRQHLIYFKIFFAVELFEYFPLVQTTFPNRKHKLETSFIA